MDDVPAIVEICRDPEISRFTNVPSPYHEEDARAFVGGVLSGTWPGVALAITEPAADAVLGAVGLHFPRDGVGEVGYWVAARARGRGVAGRALRLMCGWALGEYGFARIQLLVHEENVASQKVAERCGFRREGLMRSWAEMHGRRVDLVMYSLLPAEHTES